MEWWRRESAKWILWISIYWRRQWGNSCSKDTFYSKAENGLDRVLGLRGERYGATRGTLCSKSPGPDGIHPWVLNEIKWEIMSSVTRICNICLKIANVPKDCEVINTVSHIYVCVHIRACTCVHVYMLLAYSGAFGRYGERFSFFQEPRKTPWWNKGQRIFR